MIKAVGLILNTRKKQPVLLGKELVHWFQEKSIGVYASIEDGKALELADENILGELGDKVQCVISLGGDGTFLRSARLMGPYGIPILGVNMGTLGFLTEIEVSELEIALERLIRGDYWLEDRMMLQAQVVRNKQVFANYIGLNDVVVNKGPLARLITLEIFVDHEFVTTYQADGMIIASPTGSTAYSLSAGGPIVYPEVDVTILTPICAHTLHARPLIIPAHKKVRVAILHQQSDSMLTIDGQHGFELENGDEICIEKAPYHARLIRIKEQHFFTVLREKLKAEGRSLYE